MKRASFLGIFLLLLLLGTAAQAQTKRIYFAGYMGLSKFDGFDLNDTSTPSVATADPESTLNFAGALGLRINRNFRMEAELSYRSADFNDVDVSGTGATAVNGDLSSSMLLLNGYYDFRFKGWKTEPYVTAGLGVGYHSGSLTDASATTANFDDHDFGLVWNAGAGVKYRVKPNFAWTLGYRYLDGSEIQLNDTDVDLSSHEVRVGMEWDLAY